MVGSGVPEVSTKRRSRCTLLILATAAGACQLYSTSPASASTWGNTASSWFTPANWIGGVPDSTHDAILRAAASVINPNIGSSTASAQTLSIDNSGGGVYSISPAVTNGATTGTLTLGTGGLTNTGGGTTNLNIALAITAPTTFTINTSTHTAFIGEFFGGSATNSLTKAGAGTLDLQQDAPSSGTMTVNINAGVLEVRNSASLGAAPNITVSSATFQLDPALSYPSGIATLGPMFFGDQNTTTTLKNGSTLRDGASGNNVALPLTVFGNIAVNNTAITNITVPTGGETIFAQSFKNTTAAPTGTTSQINITGAGVVMLNGTSGTTTAYTGSWNINHGVVGNVTGQTILTSFDSLGVTSTGFAAPVTLTSGYLSDTASTAANPVPNPISLNGGVLNALATFNSDVTRTDAYFSGSITLQSAGVSTIDMSSTDIGDLSGAVCNITLSGPVSGNGTLFITAPTTNPQSPGVVTLSNISSATPNTESGNLIVQYNAALSATTSTGNSDPLGSANITLAGGELRLNHAGTGSNGTITAFSNNNITLRGDANNDLPAVTNHDGTITLGNAASANIGNTITLGSLTFDATGTSTTQTLTIQNAAGANYKAQFNGLVTLNGTATFTTGANPADVTLNNKITGPGNLIKAGNNTLTLSGISSNYTGATTVNAGTLIFNATHQIASLTVNTGARAILSSGRNKLLNATSLTINGSGVLDMMDNDAIFTTTLLSQVKGYIQTAYGNGSWSGTGLTSIAAQSTAASAHPTALGYATASSLNIGTFDGQLVSGASVLLRYTYSGDANLDGTVNLLDLNSLASNFGVSSAVWSQADFNYDGTVNMLDFNLLASNFGSSLGPPALSSLPLGAAISPSLGALVPEPTSAILFAIPLMMMRRKRFSTSTAI